MNTICENIKKIRIEKKLTQDQVAKKLGVSRAWYIKLENDEVSIKLDLLPKIAAIFNIPVNELTQVNGQNYFQTTNHNTQVKNVASIIHENDKLETLYKTLLEAKDSIILEKEERIKILVSQLELLKRKK